MSHLETVRMVRIDPTAQGPNTADVHPSEVASFEATDWRVAAEGESDKVEPHLIVDLVGCPRVVVFGEFYAGGQVTLLFKTALTDSDRDALTGGIDPSNLAAYVGKITQPKFNNDMAEAKPGLVQEDHAKEDAHVQPLKDMTAHELADYAESLGLRRPSEGTAKKAILDRIELHLNTSDKGA